MKEWNASESIQINQNVANAADNKKQNDLQQIKLKQRYIMRSITRSNRNEKARSKKTSYRSVLTQSIHTSFNARPNTRD